jgi:hypothetical protein
MFPCICFRRVAWIETRHKNARDSKAHPNDFLIPSTGGRRYRVTFIGAHELSLRYASARACIPRKRTLTMPTFALIFRTGPAVDPADLPRRNAAARDWALALQRDGVLQGASPLEDGGFVVAQRGVEPVSGDGAIASVLVVQADNVERAVALAKGHPGLAFGTEIEVRPVKAVAAPAR